MREYQGYLHNFVYNLEGYTSSITSQDTKLSKFKQFFWGESNTMLVERSFSSQDNISPRDNLYFFW